MMTAGEMLWWERVRSRGAFWYVANKGLAFVLLYPALGYYALGWAWQPQHLTEGWLIGLVCGGFVWMRKELRYHFTLERDEFVASNRSDD
jgi:sterol desaturase/sphingolipid hydroxylase (fatty acid hydroxylase superfamily)